MISQVLSQLEGTEIFRVVEECLKKVHCCQDRDWEVLSLQGLFNRKHMLSVSRCSLFPVETTKETHFILE